MCCYPNPYIEQSPLVPDVVLCDHDKDANFAHLEFAALHMWHAIMRGNSTSGQSWTSLNHLKNVLSCVNQWYHLPFRLHSNTQKTTSLTHCLVNMRKYTPRWNPVVGKTPLVFINSSTCIPIIKSIHKMHVTVFHVGKHKRHFCNLQLTVTVTTFDTKLQRECAWPSCRLKDGHVQCMGNTSHNTVQYVETQEDHTFLSSLSM